VGAPASADDVGLADVEVEVEVDSGLACGLSGSSFEFPDARADVAVADTRARDALDAADGANASDAESAADAPADAGDASTTHDADAADAPTDASTPHVISREAFACCAAQLNTALPADASFASFFTPEHAADPSIDACCRAVIAQLDAEYDPDPGRLYDDYTLAGARGGVEACCLRLHASWSETCNPTISGGPLAPPPMPPALARVTLVAPLDLRADARAIARSLQQAPELAALALGEWRQRMVDEHTSARVFGALAMQLLEAGLDARDAEACGRFAEEERRHGLLCAGVVVALGGDARATPAPMPEVPRHDDVDRHEAALRNVLSICCVSETLAVALIAAERHELPAGLLRELVRTIWADEIGHARFGWRLLARELPRLDDEARARLAAYARLAMAHELLHVEERQRCTPREDDLEHRSADAGCALVRDVLDEVLVPAFEALGLSGVRLARTTPARSVTVRVDAPARA
jgi:hypothetical protein